MVQTITTGPNKQCGTWAHLQVAIHCAMWCSAEFTVQVAALVEGRCDSLSLPGPYEGLGLDFDDVPAWFGSDIGVNLRKLVSTKLATELSLRVYRSTNTNAMRELLLRWNRLLMSLRSVGYDTQHSLKLAFGIPKKGRLDAVCHLGSLRHRLHEESDADGA